MRLSTRASLYVGPLIGMLLGCANPGVVQMSPDTYFLSRVDKAGLFGNEAAMRSDVIREATEFAARQGKVAVPISLNTTPMGIGHQATIDYQFRIVEASSAEARRATLSPLPQTRIENVAAPISAPKKDLYAALVKLDDLHKRGVLTDSEFDAAKHKLLAED